MSVRKKIGYYGYPSDKVIQALKQDFNDPQFIDLDINYGNPDAGIATETTCRIIRNIFDNAFAMKNALELIACSVGDEKCNGGLFAAEILEKEGFKVIRTGNTESVPRTIKISTAILPLREKITRIMDTVIQKDEGSYEQCRPSFGFWGVPPNDLSVLGLFPPDTHVYGWTRCVEAGTPADLSLECHVDKGVKTVFFTQSFCHKQQLAKYLAGKHGGLYIDIDSRPTGSSIAKIEAFIELEYR